MAGYIGSKAVSLNVTSGDILGDVGVGGDVSVTTGDGAILNLQTSDTTVTDGSVLGAINFTAPSEGSGTDAILLGAAIEAVSEGTFAADNNATELVFKTGATAVADTKLTLSSGGRLQLNSKHQNAISNAQTAFDNAGFRINTFNGAGSNVGVSVGHTTPNIITIQGCYNEGSTAPLAINPYGGATTIGNGLTLTDGNLTVASGHGIDFAATGNVSGTSSELLNDYEEGVFTVSLALGSGSAALAQDKLFYTKVGRCVTVSGIIRVASVSSPSGNLAFNVPFAVQAPGTGEDNPRSTVQTNLVENGNNNEVMLEGAEGSVTINLYKSASGSLGVAGNILKANTTLGINFLYFT